MESPRPIYFILTYTPEGVLPVAYSLKRTFIAAIAGSFLFGSPQIVDADMIVIRAIESDTIASVGPDVWDDNVLRAAVNDEAFMKVAGFMKFDLSLLADCANIQSITLRTFHLETQNQPLVRIYRSADDSWSRGLDNPWTGLNEVLTPIHDNFPTQEGAAYTWELNAATVNWSEDLNDNRLTLVIYNERDTGFSSTHWFGSDDPNTAPELTINFTACAVPVPSGLVLALLGGAGAWGLRRRFQSPIN
jgi:hypothetical protein